MTSQRTATLILTFFAASLQVTHPASAQHMAAPPVAADAVAQWEPLRPVILSTMGTTGGALAEVSTSPAENGLKHIAIPLEGGAIDLLVQPATIRSQNFEVLFRTAGGELRRYDAPPSKLVRGVVAGDPFSRVHGSVDGDHVSVWIEREGQETLIVRPVASLMPGMPDALHIVYPMSLSVRGEGVCGLDAVNQFRPPPVQPPPLPGVTPGSNSDAATPPSGDGGSGPGGDGGGGGVFDDRALGLFVAQISIDSDFEFFTGQGSSVNNCIDFIDRYMASVDAIYRAQVGISYSLNRIVLSTDAADPFDATSAGGRLSQVRNVWEASPYNGFERDVVQGVMGQDLDGNTIGLAYICNNGGCSGEICSRRNNFTCPFSDGSGADCGGYDITQVVNAPDTLDQINLAAHELGHNWGAQHCNGEGDCFIMCTNLNSCMGNQSIFGVSAVNSIINHRNSRSCLYTSATTIYLNGAYSGGELGTLANPYITFRAAAYGCETGGILRAFPGTYDGGHSLNALRRPMTILGQGASAASPVRIGR